MFDSKEFLTTSGPGRTLLKVSRYRALFSQGDIADSVFYIQAGSIKVTVVSEQGKEAVVAILGADQFCGQGCLAGQSIRMSTATAIVDSEITRIEKTAVASVLQEEPVFSALFMQHLLARTIRVEEDLIDQLFNSSEKRLARALLLLANFDSKGKPAPILARVSQEMLADMVGTTRSRVSFFMNKFRRLGFISYSDHIEVHASLVNVFLEDSSPDRQKVL